MGRVRRKIAHGLMAGAALLSFPAALNGEAGRAETLSMASVSVYLKEQQAREALARQVQAIAASRLASEDLTDPAERRALLTAQRAAALTLNQWQHATGLTAEIRALEPKPAMQSLEGLVFEAIARASSAGLYSSQNFAAELSSALSSLDGAVTASSLRALRADYFLTSENSTLARIQGHLQANIEARRGQADLHLATDLLERLFILHRVVPELPHIEESFSRRLAAPDMQFVDLWASRQIELQTSPSLAPVIIGIWDSGIDPEVFLGQLWVNPRERVNGRDDDGNGFVDDIHGFAFDADRRPATGMLGERPGNSDAEFERIVRYSIGWADLAAGEVTDDARFARWMAQSLSPEERAELDVNLNRFSLYTHGTGIASIALAGNPTGKLMMGRLSYRIGQAPPPIDESDTPVRKANAKQAVAYFRENSARVVNMSFRLTLPNVEASLSSIEPDPGKRRHRAEAIYNELHNSFEAAVRTAKEVLFVAGAGNANENNDLVRSFPAGIDAENLIVVGAVDAQLQAADITSFGNSVDIYALGVSVPQKLVGGRTIRYTGTSSATPQVTNLAAKMLAICPALTAADLKKVILETATLEGPMQLRVLHPRAAIQKVRATNCLVAGLA